MSEIITVGLDLAKNVFQVHGTDGSGRAVLRKKIRRGQVLEFFSQLPSCVVAMEACGGAHFWGRSKSRPRGGAKAGHFLARLSPREGVARAAGSSARCGFLWGLADVSGPTLREPVALAIHLEDVDVVGQAVEQSAGQPLRSEGLGPFVERQVAGDERGAALVALRDHLEEQLGAGL